MLMSQILAWVAAVFCIAAVIFSGFGLSRRFTSHRFFLRSGLVVGMLSLTAAGVHGLLAGNSADASLKTARLGSVLFTPNWGTAAFLSLLLLFVIFLFYKRLPKGGKLFCGGALILVVAFLCLHVSQEGIHLQERLFEAVPPVEDTSSAWKPEGSAAGSRKEEIPSSMPESAAPESEDVFSSQAAVQEEQPQSSSSAEEQGLADGVYEGSGTGRNGSISVRVTVSQGRIAEIEIVDQNETPRYFSQAKSIIDGILSAQTPEVDQVSGATLSSEGIKAAVADALKDAQ